MTNKHLDIINVHKQCAQGRPNHYLTLISQHVTKYFQVPTGKSSSGLAVAIGCGVAGAIVGTASIAFATKRILAHKARAVYDAMEPQPDGP